MKKTRSFSLVFVMLLALVVALPLGGCSWFTSSTATTQPSGDIVVVSAEKSLEAAFTVIDGFLLAEHQNRDYIKSKLPAVHATAEQLRRESPAMLREAGDAIAAYKAARAEIQRDAMESKLASVSQMAAQARTALATINKP